MLPSLRGGGGRHPRAPRPESVYEAAFRHRLALEGVAPPEFQYLFARPTRNFRFDFAWPFHKVAAEVDGGARLVRWQRNPRTGRSQPVAVGHHGTRADYEKLNLAAALGWKVFRFNPDMLRDRDALALLKEALA